MSGENLGIAFKYMITKTYKVEGMHCASCANIISQRINKLPGVKDAQVNFASEKAKISLANSLSLDLINNEIKPLGYSFTELDTNLPEKLPSSYNEASLSSLEKQKNFVSFATPITLFVFIIMMWDIGARSFSFIPNLPITMELTNLVLMIVSTIFVFWIGKPFNQGVINFIRYRVANMDTLIGLGTLSAYFYSTIITLLPSLKQQLQLPDYTYFDVVIVVIGFVILGKYLEARSKQKTGEAIEKLLNLQAKTALVIRHNSEIEIPISEVVVGDIVVVKPGGKIPVDGKIIEGETSIDESMINGEPIPNDKTIGDEVIGSTINLQGYIKFKATKVGADTMLSQIIKLVENAQGSKAPIEALADKISKIFVPSVLIIAFLSLISWLTIGSIFLSNSLAISYALLSFVGVLVIACPCALGLATPTALIVGIGKGAENGILIKDAESLEILNKTTAVVFDKTGTITTGKPEVTDVISLDNKYSMEDIIQIAASVEKNSEHPLAKAIVDHAFDKKITLLPVEKFNSLQGIGVKAIINQQDIYIHKPEKNPSDHQLKNLQTQGKTVIIIEANNQVIAYLALSDSLKKNAKSSLQKLHQKGIKTIMLTGDNKLAAKYIAEMVGIDEVEAEIMPQEKSEYIKKLQAAGHIVAMAGDGINDAPSLAQANVGIAMATGTDIAIESAGVTLLHGDISKISQVIVLAKKTMKTVKQNLFWAFIYNLIGIPLAAGAFYPLFGITLNPIFAGLAMALSSVSVVTNSLRLKTIKI